MALREHVDLKPLTTLGVGGAARWYAQARSAGDVASATEWASARRLPLLVLGGGSNVVIADEGWDGLVLHVAIGGVIVTEDGADTRFVAGAGESWDALVDLTVARGRPGLECLSGIPGTVGGTPVQNVGAYGQEVASAIEWIEAFDLHDRRIIRLTTADCHFGYRTSRFKSADTGRFVVCRVAFRLPPREPTITYPDLIAYFEQRAIMKPDVRDVREAVLAIRRRKGMVIDSEDADTRSVGSFFMNPVVPREVHAAIGDAGRNVPSFPAADGRVKIPAAWLIEHAGFPRGFGAGAVGLSTKHPLALVNRGGATARQIIDLAVRIKRGVYDRFAVWLRPEPVLIGFDQHDPEVTFLQEAQG